MSVNLPQSPLPADSSHPHPIPHSNHSPSLKSNSSHDSSHKDRLETHSSNSSQTMSSPFIAPEIGIPLLSTPEPSEISIIGAFRIWIEAARNFRNQLRASNAIDLLVRNQLSLLAVSQAKEVAQLLTDKATAVDLLEAEIQEKLNDLNEQLQDMQALIQQQQDEISKINAGSQDDQKAFDEIQKAYDHYIDQLNQMEGVTEDGNGHYSIPEEPSDAVEKYNQITNEYQQAVVKFNTYLKERSSEIDWYHANTLVYNQKVAEYNQTIEAFINDNDLTNFLSTNHIDIPLATEAKDWDISKYGEPLTSPAYISASCSVPFCVNISPLPNDVQSMAQKGPSPLPKLENLPLFNPFCLANELYNSMYQIKITPLDQALLHYVNYNSFITRQNIENLDESLSNEDLLNCKKIEQQLLNIKPKGCQSNSASLILQTLQLESVNLQKILGDLLFKQAIKQADLQGHLKFSEGLSSEKKQEKVNQLSEKMILLSIGLLSQQSVQALFPSLGIISEELASLPTDSPAFALLFAVSFCNRLGENIRHGISSQAFHTFLNSIPELAPLSPSEKTGLEASLNLSQLLIGSKLLEESLGLQGLLGSILPTLSPALNPEQMFSQITQEDQQGRVELQESVKHHFLEKGYPEDKAQFFAHVGAELIQQGPLAPHATANLSEKTINPLLLKDSITVELALSPSTTLEEADLIAEEALAHTFDYGPYLTVNQFRSSLDGHLKDLGIKHSSKIAHSALIMPLNEKSLSLTSKLSVEELIPIIEKRTIELIAPQLGTQLAKQISQDIATTLFGDPHPSSQQVADTSSPYALVHVIKDQLYQLNIQHNKNWAAALQETFTESLKTVTSFYEFSKKLQSPAYQYLRAFSIIHQNQGTRKVIDIPI